MPIKPAICPFCKKPVRSDEAVTHPQTKELCHAPCLQEASPIKVSTGRFKSGSQSFHNSAEKARKESFISAMNNISSRD